MRDKIRDAANNKAWFDKNRKLRAAYHLKKKYGLTPEMVDFTFGSQGRRCGICGTEVPGGRYNKWQIDHDHKSQRFRGVLCYKCNQLLGYAQDNVHFLLNAINYLHGGQNVSIS